MNDCHSDVSPVNNSNSSHSVHMCFRKLSLHPWVKSVFFIVRHFVIPPGRKSVIPQPCDTFSFFSSVCKLGEKRASLDASHAVVRLSCMCYVLHVFSSSFGFVYEKFRRIFNSGILRGLYLKHVHSGLINRVYQNRDTWTTNRYIIIKCSLPSPSIDNFSTLCKKH